VLSKVLAKIHRKVLTEMHSEGLCTGFVTCTERSVTFEDFPGAKIPRKEWEVDGGGRLAASQGSGVEDPGLRSSRA
jgi:hypothetical protein